MGTRYPETERDMKNRNGGIMLEQLNIAQKRHFVKKNKHSRFPIGMIAIRPYISQKSDFRDLLEFGGDDLTCFTPRTEYGLGSMHFGIVQGLTHGLYPMVRLGG